MIEKPPLPQKEYYTIGDVSRITQVEKYTLRHWEKEFKSLTPIRKSTKQRLYRKQEIDLIFQIKELLYKQKYTISGARKFLNADKRLKSLNPELIREESLPDSKILKEIKEELTQILKILQKE
ncbi:MAG: MerR family transcriptional regulator [Elusimicrobiota bacterium]|nr:MerR family transcriptional regulator [Elusimicrobiota bacterium]